MMPTSDILIIITTTAAAVVAVITALRPKLAKVEELVNSHYTALQEEVDTLKRIIMGLRETNKIMQEELDNPEGKR